MLKKEEVTTYGDLFPKNILKKNMTWGLASPLIFISQANYPICS